MDLDDDELKATKEFYIDKDNKPKKCNNCLEDDKSCKGECTSETN